MIRRVELRKASRRLVPKSAISSAMCSISSGRFGRVRANRRSSFACDWVQAKKSSPCSGRA